MCIYVNCSKVIILGFVVFELGMFIDGGLVSKLVGDELIMLEYWRILRFVMSVIRLVIWLKNNN